MLEIIFLFDILISKLPCLRLNLTPKVKFLAEIPRGAMLEPGHFLFQLDAFMFAYMPESRLDQFSDLFLGFCDSADILVVLEAYEMRVL